ncbi:tetratricopeptide repeat protein [Halpernia sp.]|uniref:tetratricopeptide repeat protein n=1 Tax=Halpernia sp. TaxID=2782209 RepID=UPI003A9548C7
MRTKKNLTFLFLGIFLFSSSQDVLEKYVNKLRKSAASHGAETAFMTAGSKFLYGQDYFENKEYDLANMYFNQAWKIDSTNAFVNYQIAASLLMQKQKNKTHLAQQYLKNAFLKNPDLKKTYEKQFPSAQKSSERNIKSVSADVETVKEINSTNSRVVSLQNKTQELTYGNYVCTESIWNGPNKSPAYSYKQKGYFELKKNGTYRWLDNGGSGKYTFNGKSGEIKWLSGPLYNMKLKKSSYERGKKVSQINLKFFSDNQWECGCNIK